MKKLLVAEELAQFAIGVVALYHQSPGFSWWIWILLFLSPDISMLGYLFNPAIGALLYNLFHHKLTATIILAVGYFVANPIALFIGLLLLTHSSFDRMMGYGLKYADAFQHTHLGWIGKKQ